MCLTHPVNFGKLTGVRHIGLRQIINEVWTNSGCSSAICKLKVYLGLLHISPVLSIYSQCNQSLKSPDRECAVKYLSVSANDNSPPTYHRYM